MKYLILFCLISVRVLAATNWFVDSSVGSSGNGLSWATAFKTLADVTGPTGDDIVQISGGSSGNTQTYAVPTSPGYWNPPSGTSGHLITYQIGQDSSHNGTAIFTPAAYELLSGPRYILFSGKYLTGADGLMHFKTSGFGSNGVFNNVDTCHIEYVDGSNGSSRFLTFSNATVLECNNCSVKVTDLALGDAPFFGLGLTGASGQFDQIKIHDCTILIPRNGPGFGTDGFECSGTGYSIYNNTIMGYNAAYSAGQHQDGIQDTGGSNHIKIYNNQFIDLANSAVYLEVVLANGYQDTYVYNNRVLIQDSSLNTGSPSGIICGINGGYSSTYPILMTNIVIANNTIADYNWGNGTAGLALSNDPNLSATFSGCYVANNVSINGTSAVGSANNTTSTISNNVFLSAAAGPTNFISYTTYSSSNDYHLAATASTLIGQGLDLSSFFTTDAAGTARTAPWDLGVFKASGSSSGGGSSLSGAITLKGGVILH